MRPWSMVPTWWYRELSPLQTELGAGSFRATSFFATLRGGAQAGASQAALRVLMAIAAADRPATGFQAQLSLDQLEELTKLSRSMVLKGIKTAAERGLMTYAPGRPRNKSTFVLLQGSEADSAGGWAKLPNAEVRERIPTIPHRGDVGLAALKIYLTLIAARPSRNTVLSLRHDTLRLKTGCQTHHVRRAISLLANAGLVHVLREEDSSDARYKAQQYQICGKLDAPRQWNVEPLPARQASQAPPPQGG